jgi:hypothetical protein
MSEPLPPDSIDGLGLTFEHLSTRGQRLAQFRATERQRKAELSDEEREEIMTALSSSKRASDQTQARFRALIAGS